MAEPAGQRRTERGLERLIFFSDAVVAIAITLIVLPLVDSARDVGEGSTAEFLSDNSYALWAAGISFVVISSFWRDHHSLYERATGYTPILVRVNLMWLAGIVFLPVVTVLDVYSHTRDRTTLGLYVGTIVVVMALLRCQELILHRAGLLADDGGPTAPAAQWAAVGAGLAALALVLAFPVVGLWSLLLLLLAIPVRRWSHRHDDRSA
ncbi:TMEM175 family protein [Nocardia asteroides]|uniref:TMEM175 family protein n=1 Tax=Nocardia asteroides TaxID=1824 RepID=UPI001E49386C|nr:TMEM175 family protein [Nocardia asteroides]UGT63110.1 DUF1211 domain-containing protein [Nocardia asteroides]